MWTLCAAGSWNWRIFSGSSVSICLLIETFLNNRQAFGVAQLRLLTRRQTANMGGTIIYVRRGLDQNSVPVPGLTHLEAIAIQVTLANKPVIISSD